MVINLDRNNQILQDLLGAINSQNLYPDEHPQTLLSIERVMANLSEAFLTEDEVVIGLFNDNILINQKPVIGIGKVCDSLIRALNKVGIDQIVFLKGLEQEEFTLFIKEIFGSEDLESSDYPHLLLGKISTVEKARKEDKYESVLDLDSSQDFIWMLKNLEFEKPFKFEIVKNLSMDLIEYFNLSASPLKYLVDIKSEDEYTYVHIINVALLSASLAKQIGIVGTELLDIIYAALIYDVGKILISKEILNKTGQLTPKEFELIKSHPIKGSVYLTNQKKIPRIAILAALEHHIKYNGGGYPTIAPGWKPHFVSQIISISEIYDALRSNRPYRPPLEYEEIIGVLRDSPISGLNPQMVEIFIEMITE